MAAALLGVTVGCSASNSGRGASASGTLRLSGSTTVNPVAVAAADVLRKGGMKITVDDQGGSAGGISQLGQGQVEIAMSSKPISAADRKMFPSTDFVSAKIGADAVGIVVRKEVFDGGVHSLNRDQLQGLFEGRIRNWKEVGGPDLDVFVYDKEPGRGTREVLDKYLYGPNGKAPPPPQSGNYAVVGANEEGRAKVLSTPGGVTPLSTAFLAGYPRLAAVAVAGIDPTSAHIGDGTYPLSRPLYLITNGPPQGAAKVFIDFVVGEEGQTLVRKSGYLTLADLRLPH